MLGSLGEERRRVTAAPFDAYTVGSQQPSEFPDGLRRERRFVGVQRGANRCLDSVPQILRRPVIETPVSEQQSRLRTKIHVRGSVYPRRAIVNRFRSAPAAFRRERGQSSRISPTQTMIVAHVGPPPRRIGGPPGYLHQLQAGAATDPRPRHDVRFPPHADATRNARPRSRPLGLLTRIRRKVFGPKFYRPSVSDMARGGGLIDGMLGRIRAEVTAESDPSLVSALAHADVIFTHEPFSAEAALARKRPDQQVWMMCHGVMPMALYAVWSWGIPEADWESLVGYADVRTWTDWELDVWTRVDRLILPCPEAGESFRTIDPRFNRVLDGATLLLSGAAAPPSTSGTNPIGRVAGERVGLYR